VRSAERAPPHELLKTRLDAAIPSSIAICRRYGFIRRGKVTDGARFDGRMLRDVVMSDNTASDVQADAVSQPIQRGMA
jgi:hypothetical protein